MLSHALAAAGLLWAGEAWKWQQTISPHFVVSHQSPWTPPGFPLALERMHNRLRRDLAIFSPWMAKERLSLYLYKDQKSYLGGEFEPPSWSNGIAVLEKKAVVVFDQPDRGKLEEVVSHEMTHLLFEGYWREAGQEPPSWINEGLAMLEEADWKAAPERSGWYQAMAYWPADRAVSFRELVSTKPTADLSGDQAALESWYVHAYSAMLYLFQKHTRLQFKSFCGLLRDGKPLEEALWTAFRYPRPHDFEAAWRKWAADPSHKARVERAPQAAGKAPAAHQFELIKSFERPGAAAPAAPSGKP